VLHKAQVFAVTAHEGNYDVISLVALELINGAHTGALHGSKAE